MFKKILVATDGSKHAEKAVNYAIALAEAFGSELIILSVVERTQLERLEPYIKESMQEIKEKMETKAKQFVDEVEKNAKNKNVKVTKYVLEGDPAELVCDQAERENVDLIVVGTRGSTGVQRVAVGSHAIRIIRWSKRPVLIAR
ncbi:MAG: universal stress protein [Candidatus Bathyarchaeia archaeon]